MAGLFPRMHVHLEDGREFDVDPDNRDAVRFDLLRNRLKWPPSGEAPVLWMSALAWSYLNRHGHITEGPEDGIDLIVSLDTEGGDEDEPSEAPDPTKTGQ